MSGRGQKGVSDMSEEMKTKKKSQRKGSEKVKVTRCKDCDRVTTLKLLLVTSVTNGSAQCVWTFQQIYIKF